MLKKISGLLFISFLLIPASSAGTVLDQVVGVVDGEVITLSDLDEAMARYGKANLSDGMNPLDRKIRLSRARKEALEMLIEDKLLQKVALSSGVKVTDEEVDKTIAKMKEEGGVTDLQMEKELASQGFTLEGYRHYLKVQIRRTRIIESLIKPKVSMEEGMIRKYFQDHGERYLPPPQIRVDHILITVPPDAPPKEVEQAKERMEKVLRLLNEGAAFEEVARLYSDDPSASSGGDLGFFEKGEMRPELEEVVFAMGVDEVSGVMRSSQGFHLFKVTEKNVGKEPLPYEEVKEKVMGDYYRSEVERLYTKWLEDLKERLKVEVKL